MKYTNILGFKGLYSDLPADMCPQGALIENSANFRIINGILKSKPGYERLWNTPLEGIPLCFYKHTKVDGTELLIALTSTDVYYWDDANAKFKFITPNWGTDDDSGAGTVQTGGTGNRTVTGTGTDWTTSGLESGDYIGFNSEGTTSEPSMDSISTWYEISSIDSDTQITLAEDGPAISLDTGYIARDIYSAGLNKRWSCISYYDSSASENLFIACQEGDAPIKWTGDTSTPSYCQNLGGNPPTAHVVGQSSGLLIFGNIESASYGSTLPYTIIWSDTTDAETWDGTGASGYQELYDTEGAIKWIADFGTYAVVGKEDCITTLIPTGNAISPFQIKYPVRGEGSAFDIYLSIKGWGIAFLTGDDIVIFDGTSALKSIAEGKIRRTFFEGLDFNKSYLVTGAHAPRYDEWRITVPKLDASYPTETWIYQIKTGEWFYDDKGYTTIGAYNYKTQTTIDSLSGSIDSLVGSIDSFSEARAYDDIVMGNKDGYVFLENPNLKTEDSNTGSSDVNAIIITRDEVGADIDVFCRFSESQIHYKGTIDSNDGVDTQISVNSGDSYTNPQTFNVNEAEKRLRKTLHWNKTGRVCRHQMSGRHFEIYGIKLGFVPEGVR